MFDSKSSFFGFILKGVFVSLKCIYFLLGDSDSQAENDPFKVFHSVELSVQVDDFKVWDFELDETEVRHVYETGKEISPFCTKCC